MTVMGPDGLSHIPPSLPVTAVKTYQFTNPMRPATCEEVNCGHYLNGWRTTVDESTELGQQQAYYMRHDRSRKHTETRTETGLTQFTFEPGQRCFAAGNHRLPWDGRERFFERGGDWRGQTSPTVEHSPTGWLDSFGEHQERVKDAIERG